jgi:2-polyprenyl-3-methyl-5-hydroxy-6-metoxy-1,4-benzoquinol methylase
MSISETFTYEHKGSVDTSNYRKHTSSSAVQRALIDRFHKKIASIVKDLEPQTLLDCGAGEGFVSEIFLSEMPALQITGFDVLPDSVELAQRRNPRANFSVGSIYDIEHPDNAFDVTVAFEVLEHLHEPHKALAEMARVAKEYVVLSVPHEPFFCLANAARGKNLDITPKGSDPDHRNFWGRKDFGEFVSKELDVVLLTGSMPWTICVGKVRG